MRILDLFCGEGGASMGLHRAFPNAEITGVDNKKMARYPFTFVHADAMTYPLDGYDFIWASPPCQRYSRMFNMPQHRADHPDLVDAIRQRLLLSGAAYCIENVEGSPVRRDYMLCGSMFGLKSSEERQLRRHRVFEVSFTPQTQLKCNHQGKAVGVYGHGRAGHEDQRHRTAAAAEAKVLLGIDWMCRDAMAQAVPPAYSEFIGRELIEAGR